MRSLINFSNQAITRILFRKYDGNIGWQTSSSHSSCDVTYLHHASRENIISRRAMFELAKAEKRAHILEGLVKAQDRIDDVLAAGKMSTSRDHFESILRGM